MTVLAIKNYEDRIELACDQGVFWGGSGMKENRGEKIRSINNDFHFASTGLRSESNLFELYCSKHSPEINNRYGILQFYADFLKWKKKHAERLEQECAYFIIYESLVYEIGFNFNIFEIKTGSFSSHGAGMKVARCAMYLGKSPKEAVEWTLKLNAFVSGGVDELIINKKG